MLIFKNNVPSTLAQQTSLIKNVFSSFNYSMRGMKMTVTFQDVVHHHIRGAATRAVH